MEKILFTLSQSQTTVRYVVDSRFYWSPNTQEIHYNPSERQPVASWSLLHETAHASLGHNAFHSDYELLDLERSAWALAQNLAVDFNIVIDPEHIEDCLDTYRDWLYRRAQCPRCNTQSLQTDHTPHYACFNCDLTWRVAPTRLCRSYRRLHQKDTRYVTTSSVSLS